MKHRLTFLKGTLLLFLVAVSYLSAQTITVTAPNGGEYWIPGTSHTIGWTETGLTGTLSIDYSSDNGTTWISITSGIAVTNTPSTYTWTIPTTSTTNALVRVTEVGGSGAVDESDAVFTIHDPKLGIPTLTTPADAATLVALQPTFTWAENGDAAFDTDEEYELIIATDQWFSTVVYSNTSIAYAGATTSLDLSTTATTLSVNTKYYWKVRAKMTSVSPTEYSPWSSTFVFTTTPAAVEPTQTFPIGGNTVYTNTPTFYWYTGVVSSDQKFEIWYGVSGTVGTPTDGSAVGSPGVGVAGGTYVPFATIGTDLNYTIPGASALTSNTDYKWWVRSTDGTNVSDWSNMGTFHTSSTNGGPVKPVGTYPTSGEYQYTNNPTLYWYIITQVTGLQFEVSYTTSATALPAAGTIVAPATVGTNYFYQLSGLTSSTTYYWWVRSYDGSNYSDWSDKYTFTTTEASGSPVKPVLTYPANGETVYYSDVELHWYATTVATDLKYDLYWGTSSTAPTAATTPTTTGITDLYTTVNGLTANTTYYWWVRSTDNAGLNPSAWSDMGTFVASESAAQVKVPTQMYPTGGITVTGTSVELSWSYNGSMTGITFAARYSLYPDMTLPTTITLTDPTATSQTLSGLSTGTTYYWQVRATDGTYTSAWAGPAEFSTWASSAAPLVMPKAGSPIAEVVIDTDSPTLSWFLPTKSEDLLFDLQYSLSGDFNDAVEINKIATNYVQLNNLLDGEKYYWRVRSNDGAGNVSLYSAIGTFIGKGITDVNGENIIPEKFDVSQNYPNPFNPSTVIEYSLPSAEFVTLKIYNMLGQEVATLVNQEIEAGIHNVSWNGVDNTGAKVATGTYIYRVVAGNNIITKKMILLK